MDVSLVEFLRVFLIRKDVALNIARRVVQDPPSIRKTLPLSTRKQLTAFVLLPDSEAAADRVGPGQRRNPPAAAVFDEPVLADVCGYKGAAASADKSGLHPDVATTKNAAAKVVEFSRALCAEPVFDCSTNGDCGAISAVKRCRQDEVISADALAQALEVLLVRQLRVLRGAVVCLPPAVLESPSARHALPNVLLAIQRVAIEYLQRAFVQDGSWV